MNHYARELSVHFHRHFKFRDGYEGCVCMYNTSVTSLNQHTAKKKGEIKDIGRMKKRKQENSDSPAEDMASCVTR